MLMRRSSLIFLLWSLLLPVMALAEPRLRGLDIEGVPGDSVWMFLSYQGDKPEDQFTQVWARYVHSQTWYPQAPIPFRVDQVTHTGDNIVVLLGSGDWILVNQASGPALPGRAKILSLAGDQKTLWALAEAAPSPSTAPSPTTGPATAPATLPVKNSAGERVLYELVSGQWKPAGPVPAEVLGEFFALGAVEGRPVVASAGGGALRLWRLSVQGQWAPFGEHPLEAGLKPAKILMADAKVLVYLKNTQGKGQLLTLTDHWLDPLPLASGGPIQALGVGGGYIRFAHSEGKDLKERKYDPRTMAVEGADEVVVLPRVFDPGSIWGPIQLLDMVLIVLVMIHTHRMRDAYQHVKIDFAKYELCPFGKRAFAAMIDLAPVLATLIYVRFNVPHVEKPEDVFLIREAFYWYCASVAVYLLHTTLTECIFGRSIGKMVSQMHVVGLDGKRPPLWALLVRNVLRIIDITLVATPLVALYLPLRQRLGDLGAATVVVSEREEHAGVHG